jgi:CheY-like chemotaxis protein
MRRGGTLSIETSSSFVDESSAPGLGGIKIGPYVCLTISDTGTGMEPEIAAQAFEPFFTTKRFGEGSGLGLATVYGIVTQADGHATLYSEPRIGTTFRIYLPSVEGAVEEEELILPNTRRGSGETVLIAEDDSAVLDLAARILKKSGYNVQTATSGETALAHAREAGPIDVLLTDVIMPRMSGRELAIHLATIRPEVKVLFMSGYTADIIGRHGILDQDQNYMQKPFTSDELLTKIQEVLDS